MTGQSVCTHFMLIGAHEPFTFVWLYLKRNIFSRSIIISDVRVLLSHLSEPSKPNIMVHHGVFIGWSLTEVCWQALFKSFGSHYTLEALVLTTESAILTSLADCWYFQMPGPHPECCELRQSMTKPTKQHAPNEDTDQPVWSEASLSTWGNWAHSEDWSDWANAQADLSLRWAHMSFCWFCLLRLNWYYNRSENLWFIFINVLQELIREIWNFYVWRRKLLFVVFSVFQNYFISNNYCITFSRGD